MGRSVFFFHYFFGQKCVFYACFTLIGSWEGRKNFRVAGHDVNFCSDLPRRASEIIFSLALLQLSLALVKLYIMIL